MHKKFKRKFKKHISRHITSHIEKLRAEEEIVITHFDPDGKVIFLNETITPNWLIDKLNTHFTNLRNEGVKCWGITV